MDIVVNNTTLSTKNYLGSSIDDFTALEGTKICTLGSRYRYNTVNETLPFRLIYYRYKIYLYTPCYTVMITRPGRGPGPLLCTDREAQNMPITIPFVTITRPGCTKMRDDGEGGKKCPKLTFPCFISGQNFSQKVTQFQEQKCTRNSCNVYDQTTHRMRSYQNNRAADP